MINSKVRSEVTQIVNNIEVLAGRVRTALATGANVLASANELVANTVTLTFSVGELYALESSAVTNTVPNVSVNVTKAPQVRYHNVRDNRGRFTRVSSSLP